MLKKRNPSGFTLIELLLVIGILGILSVIGLATFTNSIVRGKDTRRKNDLAQLAKGLESFNNDFGSYPDDDSLGGLIGCTSGGQITLVECPPASSPRWQVSKNIGGNTETVVYIDTYPTDPDSNRVYYYKNTSSGSTQSYALYASLENLQDKDARRDISGEPVAEGWDFTDSVDCGAGVCNYKVTQGGLVRE